MILVVKGFVRVALILVVKGFVRVINDFSCEGVALVLVAKGRRPTPRGLV
jgi:hypothetical protein